MLAGLVRRIFGATPRLDPTVQRRGGVRVPCGLPVECAGPLPTPGVVVDISEGGLRLEVPMRVRLHSLIEVRYLGPLQGHRLQRRVRCRVKWVHRVGDVYQAGLMFEESAFALATSWVVTTLRTLFRAVRTSDDRRHLRCATELETSVRMETLVGAETLRGRVLDLSMGGALFSGSTVPPLHAAVELRVRLQPLRFFNLEARVVRRASPRSGLAQAALRFERVTEAANLILGEVVREHANAWRAQQARPAPSAAIATVTA